MSRLIKSRNGTVQLSGPSMVQSDRLLDSSYFPVLTTGTLYAWNDFAQGTLGDADWTGSKDLSEVVASSYGTDHLGTSNNALALNGTTQAVYSSDAVFDAADTSFSAGLWLKYAGAGSSGYIMSKYGGGSNSWYCYTSTAGLTDFRIYNSSDSVNFGDTPTELADGLWHHVVVTFETSTGAWSFFIDGQIRGHVVHANAVGDRTNGAGSALTYGAYGNGTATTPLTASMADMFYVEGQALDPNEVRKIYAAGSQKFVTEDSNSKVAVLDGRKNNGYVSVFPTAQQTMSQGSWAAVSGHQIHIPESGTYRLVAQGCIDLIDLDGTTAQGSIALASGSTNYQAYTVYSGTDLTAGQTSRRTYNIEKIVFLTAGTVINLRATTDAADNSRVSYSSGLMEPSISWELLS